MKSRDWKDIAELIGIAAIVASLIFVGLQMKQAQDIADAERRVLSVSNRIELSNSINAHADIWARGKSGAELDEAEFVIFDNLMLSTNAYYYHGSRAARNLGNDYGARASMLNLANFLQRNPGALRVWTEREDNLVKIRSEFIPDIDSRYWVARIQADIEKIDQLPD